MYRVEKQLILFCALCFVTTWRSSLTWDPVEKTKAWMFCGWKYNESQLAVKDTLSNTGYVKDTLRNWWICSPLGETLVSESYWSGLNLSPFQILELLYGGSHIFPALCLALPVHWNMVSLSRACWSTRTWLLCLGPAGLLESDQLLCLWLSVLSLRTCSKFFSNLVL